MKRSDVVVVGSGMAGLVAALAAAARGKSVNLVSRGAGALAIGGGCVDFLGYVGKQAVQGDPFAAIAQLPPEHPYRLVGPDAVRSAFDFFSAVCREHGLPLDNTAGSNVWIPTILGTFRPTWLCPAHMDRNVLKSAAKILVTSMPELKDCHAGMVIQVLRKQKFLKDKEIEALNMPIPFGQSHRNLTPLDVARFIDTPEGTDWLQSRLAPHAAPGVVFLMPPILGITRPQEVWQRLSSELGCPLVEMATSPPGVGGLRIRHVLLDALAEAGVIIAENVLVSGAGVEGRRCTHLICDAPDQQRELAADSFIIATGGFLGGGLKAAPGKGHEVIFGLDPGTPAGVENWSVPDIFESQPYARSGVSVNSRLNPVSPSGETLLDNVFFAGRTLAGYDFVLEKSGNGVALSSGFHAAQQC